jgi:hypothetical protein
MRIARVLDGAARARPKPAVVMAVAVALAGCGSTVAPSAGSLVAGNGLASHGAGASSAAVTGGLGGPGSSAAAIGATGGGPAVGAAPGPGGVQPATSGSLVAQARSGAGPVTVRLGVIYLKGLDQAYKAVDGGKSASTDSAADYAAIIHAINTRPGSRLRLAPSYYAVDASSTQSQDNQLQAACSYFTSDVHVDVVVTYSAAADAALASCLQGHHIPLVDGSAAAELGAGLFSSIPGLWAPAQLSLDRLGALEPSYLVANHWIDGRWSASPQCAAVTTPRVGVVTFDRPDWRAMYDHVVAPTFKALGHPVYDAVFFSVSGSTGQQVAQASSAAQNAVLKFASECIDHVAFVANVAVDYLFMNIAAQQQYTPRYGLSSLEAPPVIIQNLPTSAASQLHGSMGPGWAPFADVNVADFDAAAKQPGAECIRILTQAGHAPTDNNSAILALPACDGPLFVAAVFDRWIADRGAVDLLGIVNGLGSAYRPAGTFTGSFSRQQHDGAATYRGFSFNDACDCFRYVTAARPVR